MTNEQQVQIALETKRKLAYTAFRVLTIGSFDWFYQDLGDLETKVRYKMETRVQYYLKVNACVTWDQAQNIKEQDSETLDRMIMCLTKTNYNHIRNWWKQVGRERFYAEREEKKQQEQLARCAIVFRVDEKAFVQFTDTNMNYVTTPGEATGFSHTANIEQIEKFLAGKFNTVRPIVIGRDKVSEVKEEVLWI